MSVFSTRHNSSRRNFRRAKNALAYAAALIGVYAASIGSASLFPANAQTVTLDTDCSKYKADVIGADTICEYKKNDLAHQREHRLDADLTDQAKMKACIQEIALFKQRDPESFKKLNLTPAYVVKYACDISKILPRPTASNAAPSPAGG